MDFSLNQEMSATNRICMPLCNRIINTDTSEDFTLPDYNSEIRRVLYVKENLLSPAKFINGNKLDVNGVIDYTVVYVSSDGRLCSAPLSSEYGFSIALENVSDFEMSEGITVMVHSVSDGSTVRVTSPRKLQIRSHIRSCVNAWGKKVSGEKIEGINDPASIQRLMRKSTCAEMFCENSDVVSLVDEYQLPDASWRIVLADSNVYVDNCKIDGELVRINGSVILKILMMHDEDMKKEIAIRKIPFEAESELLGVAVAEDGFCRVCGTVTDISLNVDEMHVGIEANLVLEVCMGQNREITYTGDIYSTEQAAEVITSTQCIPTVLFNKNFNFSQSERISLEELNLPEDADIIDVAGSATAEEAVCVDSKFVLRGNSKYNVVYVKNGEYGHCEVKVPFKYDGECGSDIDGFDSVMGIVNCRARRDGDFLSIEGEICAACTLMGKNVSVMLDKATFKDELVKETNEWTVCYIHGNEDAWDIAKKNCVRVEDIAGDPAKDKFVIIEK